MEVRKTQLDQRQVEQLRDDNIDDNTWKEAAARHDDDDDVDDGNGIEKLEKIQDMSSSCSAIQCHATQYQDENKQKNEETSDIQSKVERDPLEKELSSSIKSAQSPSALAFTIDFGGNNDVDSAIRYQNLFQRYNARHKRNLSTSKLEIKTKKPIVDVSPNFQQKHKPLSLHSEGYFSSEDETKRKADRLSQKLKELGLKTTSKGATKKSDLMTRSERTSETKRRSYHEESTNNCSSYELTYSATMNDLSKIQSDTEANHNRVQYSPEKKYTKNIEYIEINHEYTVESMEKSSLETTEKLSNVNYNSENYSSNDGLACSSTNLQTPTVNYSTDDPSTDCDRTNIDGFNVSNADDDDDESDETVSESGTYTIHKDYTDEEKARMDIDKAFSVGVLTEEESNNELYVHHFKMRSSRDTNTWISEWATQVAEHYSLPPTIGGNTTSIRTPPMSPSKIPSPIYSRSAQRGIARTRYEQSDSSLDADIQQMRERIGPVTNQNSTLIDSGGESDEDTSNSYNTPPHSSQRTPTHNSHQLVRRGSFTETLFKRTNNNDTRRSMRKYPDLKKKDEILFDVPKSPSHVLARLALERSNSLDRKSDTAESNSSRRSSLRNYSDDQYKHTNSPILSRLRATTPKLTNSPILGHKNIPSKMLNSPSFDRAKQLLKSGTQNKNIGYFTAVENSPYMLRKSNSTSNYREDTSLGIKEMSVLDNNNPITAKNINIQRSTSNTSIRNAKIKSSLTRRSSFNDHIIELRKINKGNTVSDSSSEAGETQLPQPAPPISSGIKLNRAFSIRRARVNCDSDTTPNTTPEERRRKAQTEIKSAPSSARQTAHHRARTNSVGGGNKEVFKKPEARPRVPSLSRNESGRYSMRAPKNSHATSTRPNMKINNKETKNSGRSNSSLTSKEVEFQNWKRRKNYDPMKAAAEGKKKLDNSRKHYSTEESSISRDNSVLRSASFHGTGGALALADDWSDNELNSVDHKEIMQIPPPCSPLGSDSDLDTSSYLQTTQNVMTAMSARMTVYQSAPVDSGGESDEDTSHSLRQTNKITHAASDTESSDDQQPVQSSTGMKFNRSFELRRERQQREDVKATVTKMKPAIVSPRPKTETSIARTDSGRFSMRMTKGTASSAAKNKTKDVKQKIGAQNTMSREQELQNWKRRKSYDPMKAALEGKRKAGLAKKNLHTESSSVLRSQSFHGPVTLGISEWSDEDISASADEAPIY